MGPYTIVTNNTIIKTKSIMLHLPFSASTISIFSVILKLLTIVDDFSVVPSEYFLKANAVVFGKVCVIGGGPYTSVFFDVSEILYS